MGNPRKNAFIVFAELQELSGLNWLRLRYVIEDTVVIGSSGDTFERPSNDTKCEQNYTRLIWKCRELLFTNDNVLASPSPGTQSIDIIIPKSLLLDKNFLCLLDELKLLVLCSAEVGESIFRRCLIYTIYAKIAPQWNKVGEYLVQGRNFLANKRKLSAIHGSWKRFLFNSRYKIAPESARISKSTFWKLRQLYSKGLEVNVCKNELCLVPTYVSLIVPSMQIDELNIRPDVLANFYQNKLSKIDGSSLEKSWCHVLPSMKKGIITSITRDIPNYSLFRNYEELKSYWKNSYGYRIPELEENSAFFNLRFCWMNDIVYTYPSVCVAPYEPMVAPQATSIAVATHAQFQSDLLCKMPRICGLPWLKMEQPVMQLSVNLQPAGEQHRARQYGIADSTEVASVASQQNSCVPFSQCSGNILNTPEVLSSQLSTHVSEHSVDATPVTRIFPKFETKKTSPAKEKKPLQKRKSLMPTRDVVASKLMINDDLVSLSSKNRVRPKRNYKWVR